MECLEESDYMGGLKEKIAALKCAPPYDYYYYCYCYQHSSFIHTGWWMDSGRSTRVVNHNNSGNGNDNESDT